MRQLVQDLRSGDVELIEVPVPQPGPGEILVRTRWSLISPGTEQAVASTAAKSLIGKARERPDQVRKVLEKAARDGVPQAMAAVRARMDDLLTPGYSSSGIVEAVGEDAPALAVGTPVACFGANAAVHAEFVAMPAPLTLELPGGLDSRWGAFGALGAIAGHGLRIAGIEPGSVVAVIGLGLIGQLATQLAVAGGARVVGIDVDASRAALAAEFGAIGTAVLGSGDPEEAVLAASGGAGADALVIAASTDDNGPIELAGRLARDRAVVSVIGDVAMDVPRAVFYEKELSLRVSRSYGPGRYDRSYEVEGRDYPIGYVRWPERRLIRYFLEEVAAGRVRLEQLVTHEFGIASGLEAYAALSEPERLAILISYPDERPSREEPRAITLPAPAATVAGKLRCGIVGPGLFARSTLLPALRKADVDLVGVAGRSPARTVGVARRWGARTAATDASALLADPEIDAVVIATQHDSHARLAAEAIGAGKAVFVEKPLSIDREGLERLWPLMTAGGRLVVDFNRDFAPATRRVVGMFAGRSDPLLLNCRVNAGFLEPDHWLRDPVRGGGRLVGEGCHFVQLCSTIVARSLESVRVSALGAGPRTLVGDNFVLELGYDDGSRAVISYLATGSPRMQKERVEVLGAGRSAVIEDFRTVKTFAGSRLPSPSRPRLQDKGHEAIVGAAIDFFRRGGEPPTPYARLRETTLATLVARDLLERGDTRPAALADSA